MAVSEKTGGTQTAVIATEHTLATIAAAGTYQLGVNTSNLVDGDTVELRVKVKLRSGNTLRQVFKAVYTNNQGDDEIKISPPVPAPFEFVATLKQTAGTGRAFIWSIYEY